MSNIIITSTAKTFKVESGVNFLDAIGATFAVKKRSDITAVYINKTSDLVCVQINGLKDFLIAPTTLYNDSGEALNILVDSINGINLVTLQDIFDNFSILMEV